MLLVVWGLDEAMEAIGAIYVIVIVLVVLLVRLERTLYADASQTPKPDLSRRHSTKPDDEAAE